MSSYPTITLVYGINITAVPDPELAPHRDQINWLKNSSYVEIPPDMHNNEYMVLGLEIGDFPDHNVDISEVKMTPSESEVAEFQKYLAEFMADEHYTQEFRDLIASKTPKTYLIHTIF